MPIRISGMTSGLDTDSIVKELVSAYSTKKDTYTKAQTKLSWKQDAWKGLNTKIYGLYNNIGKMRYDSAYAVKKATISDATKATVSAASNAVAGTYSVKIGKLATAGYLTGAKLTDEKGGKVTTSTKLSDLGFEGTEEGTISVKVGDTTKDINITKDTTVGDFVKELGNAGVNASFDANHGRIYVSAKKTGAENDFTILGDNKAGSAALSALGLVTKEEVEKQKAEYAELARYTDPQAIQTKIKDDEKGIKNCESQINTLNMGIAYGKALANQDLHKASGLPVKESGDLPTEEEKQATEDSWNKLIELMKPDAANDTEKQEQLKSLQEKFGFCKDVTIKNEDGSEVTSKELDTESWNSFVEEQELISKVKTEVAKLDEKSASDLTEEETFYKNTCAGVDEAYQNNTLDENQKSLQASIDDNQQRIDEFQKDIDSYPLVNSKMSEDELNALKAKATYASEMLSNDNNFKVSEGATRIAGQDSSITVNGAEYTGDSNTISINGLTINATAVTDNNGFTVTVNSDSQGIYDSVKDFLSEYNSLINEMTKLYNAASSKGYEPLTDDEKDAMSDSEVEKWETKIKDSLFRRDTTLNGVMSAMKTAMSSMYEVNGQKYSLSNFGISTLGFMNSAENEQNAYHIDGDEDDSTTSGKTDKLMKAINEDPDAIIDFMKQLSKGLYSALDAKMKSTDLSSAYKVYNDKEMDKQYKNYTSLISKWEDKIADKEDYYYKKFSAMESAMTKLDSQTSSLSSLFGM